MHRSHMGVARFYDWSEEKDEGLSISRLYRNNVAVSWPANNTRVNPGRMFLRDKGMLTKGEREIIEGICRNRGDVMPRREGCKSEFYVRSHHDAWMLGKVGVANNKPSTEVPREGPRGGLMEITAPPNQGGETPRGGGGGCGGGQTHRNTCIMCMREQQLLQQVQQQKQEQQQAKQGKANQHLNLARRPKVRPANFGDAFKSKGEGEGRTAPPSTPDGGHSPIEGLPNAPSASVSPAKLLPRRQEAPSSEIPTLFGASPLETSRSWETDSSDSDSRDSSSRRKVHVRVVLPKVASDPADDDIRACMMQGRPVLAREKHLSHSDLKVKVEKDLERGPHERLSEVSLEGDEDDEDKEIVTPGRKSVLPAHHITLLAADNDSVAERDC
nr:hypothetical protein BaRGS_029506 [Batillaria attramentaria]